MSNSKRDDHNAQGDEVTIDLDAAEKRPEKPGAQTIMMGGSSTMMLDVPVVEPGNTEPMAAYRTDPSGDVPLARSPLMSSDVMGAVDDLVESLSETNMAQTIVAGSAPRRTAPGSAGPKGTLVRRYKDGKMMTASGHLVEGEGTLTGRVVDLPYEAGEVIDRIGPYDIIGELGRGAMGVVYRAFSINLQRVCALKVMRAGESASEAELIRFQNEAMLAARLNHPNIVQVYDSGDEDDMFYFVMEYIKGPMFEALIDDGTPEAVELGLTALAQTARALAFAHDKGVVHRDIKPDNILLDGDYAPHITDFGIAKSTFGEDAGLTADGAAVGTPFYMPPEQANGEVRNIGPLSDVYALGATMYHLITGRVPFDGETVFAVLVAVMNKDPVPPRQVCREIRGRDLSIDLETICLKAMEKEAERRYPTALAFAEDIEAALADRPIRARPISGGERFQKLLRRNRPMLVGVFVTMSVLILMTVAFGSVVAFNIHRSSESLRDLDRQAALDEAGILERAIRTNMLQGRADVAREVVNKLREEPGLNRIAVVRTNRKFAYTDRSTRDWIVKRLSDPKVLAWIKEEHPDMVSKVEMAATVAVPNIDAVAVDEAGEFPFDADRWDTFLENEEPLVELQHIDGEPHLLVLKPIINSEKCQVCHGKSISAYGSHNVRAVLAIHRSQAGVERRIRENQLATLGVGLVTTFLFLFLVFIFARLFGIGLKPKEFGQRT